MTDEQTFASRGGLKLAAALDAFGVEPRGWTCADLGASVGGFTDCLLQHGAANVYSVDTAYGQLAWSLRQDERVVVLERTNVLHFDPAPIDGFEGCDLAVLDLGWTRQQHAIPAALRWLKQTDGARVISLIKPHYEASREAARGGRSPDARGGDAKGGRGKSHRRGVLSDEEAEATLQRVLDEMSSLGVNVLATIESPIRGGGKRGGGPGNREWLALCERAM